MILFIPILLVALALTLAAPPAAGWAAAELSSRLESPARVLVTVLAIVASSWWWLVPRLDLAVCGALLSWIGTSIAFASAMERRRAHVRSAARYPVMPPAWYAPTAAPWPGRPVPQPPAEAGGAAPHL